MEKNLSPFLLERDLEILVKKSLQAYFENVSDCLMFIGKKKDKGAVTLFLNFDDNFFIIKKVILIIITHIDIYCIYLQIMFVFCNKIKSP